MADTQRQERQPDLVRNYRPVAIRFVIAAHAMVPKTRSEAACEPAPSGMGFALPAGFHNPSED